MNSSQQQIKEEKEKITLATRGDQAAFNALVESFRRPVYDICYRLLDDPMAAEDATQEVFIRAYFKGHTFDPSRKYSNWLFSIASHYCLDQLRRQHFHSISWEDLPKKYDAVSDKQPTPEAALLQDERREQVRTIVYNLPPRYRKPMLFKYWRGLSCADIAKQLNMSVGSVKTRLYRGRKMVSEALVQ